MFRSDKSPQDSEKQQADDDVTAINMYWFQLVTGKKGNGKKYYEWPVENSDQRIPYFNDASAHDSFSLFNDVQVTGSQARNNTSWSFYPVNSTIAMHSRNNYMGKLNFLLVQCPVEVDWIELMQSSDLRKRRLICRSREAE